MKLAGVKDFFKSGGRKIGAAFAVFKRDPALAAFALVVALFLLLALGGTSSEWLYHHQGWNGAQRSINARNFLRFGYFATGFAAVDNVGPAHSPDGKRVKQAKPWHHPPGYPLMLSLVFALFGESETAARLFTMLLLLATVLMLIYIFRKSWGDADTLLACVFLTFIPIFAGYINFVNYEPFAIFSMVGVIFAYENFRQERKWWKVVFLILFILATVYSDYVCYPFLLYFLIVLVITESRREIRQWNFVAAYVEIVLIAGAVLLIHFLVVREPGTPFSNLFLGRFDLGGDRAYISLLKKWDFYVWFFNPLAMVFTAYWLLDFIVRTFLVKLKRADGYIAVLFLTALTYWLVLPQAASMHEYTMVYFAVPVALAAGGGLWKFCKSVSYGSKLLRLPVAGAAAALFILVSLPHIYMKKISPVYEFTQPLHEIKLKKKFDLQISYNIMARFMKENSEPDEILAIYPGLDIRPEFHYYFDRLHRVYLDRLDLIKLKNRKDHSFIFVNQHAVWSDFLSYLIKHHDFVFYDNYYAFDLQNRVKKPTVLARVFKKTLLPERYFRSLVYEGYSVQEDRWRSLDLAVKLRKRALAQALKEALGDAKPDTLTAAVATYNYQLSMGKRPKLDAVKSRLDAPSNKRTIFGKSIEYLGSRLDKRDDGRTVLQMVFKPIETLDHNFTVELRSEPLHENEKLRMEIGFEKTEARFLIPSTMWKSGYLYILEEELQLFPGPYRLSFVVKWIDYFQIINSKSNDNAFPITCRQPAGEPFDAIAQISARMMEIDARGPMTPKKVRALLADLPITKDLVERNLEDYMTLHGCCVIPTGGNKWLLRLFLQNRSLHGRDLNLTVIGEGKGKFEKVIPLGELTGDKGPGSLFWVEETVDTDPREAKIKIVVGAESMPAILKTNYGSESMEIAKGDYGIDFPLQWLNWPLLLWGGS